MTRETKVGLVVGASFLCLVGVVVASRMRKSGDADNNEPVAQKIAPVAEGSKKDEKDAAAQNKSEPPGVQQASLNVVAPTTSVPPVAPPNALPAPPAIPSPSDLFKPVFPDAPPLVAANPSSKPPDPNFSFAELTIKPNPGPGVQVDDDQEKTKRLLAQAKLEGPPTNFGQPQEPPAFFGPPRPEKNETPVPAPMEFKFSDPPPASEFSSPPKEAPKIETPMNQGGFKPEPPPVAPPTVNLAPRVETAPPITSITPKAEGKEFTFGPTPAAPPLGSNVNPPPINPPMGNPPVPEPKKDPVKITNAEPPAPGFNRDVGNPNVAPLGAEIKNTVPPISIAPINVKPQAPTGNLPAVKSFDVDTYFVKPGETSFEAISNLYFKSPKYAHALHQYNRVHPLAKDNVREDNPRLQPGQAVFVPPREVLEAKFAAHIDNRAAPGVVPPISISPPVNSNPAGQNNPVVGRVQPATQGPGDASKRYRVPGQGQMMLEIAQQTLGDRGRWSEIYRLNPNLRPEQPVPGGMEIRLPANANVP